MKANRLWGDLKVETKEIGQLAIALCHICVCFTQNRSFTYVSGTFFFKKKYKAAAEILISRKLIPNPIQVSAKWQQSKTGISKRKHSKNELKDISFYRPTILKETWSWRLKRLSTYVATVSFPFFFTSVNKTKICEKGRSKDHKWWQAHKKCESFQALLPMAKAHPGITKSSIKVNRMKCKWEIHKTNLRERKIEQNKVQRLELADLPMLPSYCYPTAKEIWVISLLSPCEG